MHILEHEQKGAPQQKGQSITQSLCSEDGARTMEEEEWIQILSSFLARGFFEGRKTTQRITESHPTGPSQKAKEKQPELRAACWSIPDGYWFFLWFRVHQKKKKKKALFKRCQKENLLFLSTVPKDTHFLNSFMDRICQWERYGF